MVIHNLGTISPPDMDDFPPSGVNLFSAICHPAFPMYPDTFESEPFPTVHTFTNSFQFPPGLILASLWTKVFKVSYSLSAGAVSISGTDVLAAVKSGSTFILTLAERLSDDYSAARATLTDSDSDSGDSMTFTLALPFVAQEFWVRDTGTWRLDVGLNVLFNSSKRVSTNVNTSAYPEPGVTLTYFGEVIPVYANDATALGEISGSVTVEAEEYLDPL